MLSTRVAQRKRAIPHSMIVTVALCDVTRWTSVTSVVVTALCNQPEAFASVLGDGSHVYLSGAKLRFRCSVPLSCQCPAVVPPAYEL